MGCPDAGAIALRLLSLGVSAVYTLRSLVLQMLLFEVLWRFELVNVIFPDGP